MSRTITKKGIGRPSEFPTLLSEDKIHTMSFRSGGELKAQVMILSEWYNQTISDTLKSLVSGKWEIMIRRYDFQAYAAEFVPSTLNANARTKEEAANAQTG